MFESYYNRALQSSDPRYRKIFEAMGYGKRELDKKAVATEPPREAAAADSGKGKPSGRSAKKDAPLEQSPAPNPEQKPAAKAESEGDD